MRELYRWSAGPHHFRAVAHAGVTVALRQHGHVFTLWAVHASRLTGALKCMDARTWPRALEEAASYLEANPEIRAGLQPCKDDE